MDASAGGKKGSLEDSAAIEVKNLIQRITQAFYTEFDQRREKKKCCRIIYKPNSERIKKIIDCENCSNDKQAKAACAYIYSYQISNKLSAKSSRRILSFPWLFSKYLIKLRYTQRPEGFADQRYTITGHACSAYLNDLRPKFKVFIPQNATDVQKVDFYYSEIVGARTSLLQRNTEKQCTVPLLRICFVEILNDWLTKQDIFGASCVEIDLKPLIPKSIWNELMVHFLTQEYQPNFCPSPSNRNFLERYQQAIQKCHTKWTNIESEQLQEMFREIHLLAANHAKRTTLTIWAYLDEYMMLALQCIGIEQRLVDKWINSTSSA